VFVCNQQESLIKSHLKIKISIFLFFSIFSIIVSQHNNPMTTITTTWNDKQLQQNQVKTTTTIENVKSNCVQQAQSQSTVAATASNSLQQTTQSQKGGVATTNVAVGEQKPVECNLCHRKFKNIPALNGHMRLHGGYFKKDTDTKKSDRKESSGPPLQTASVGVRALIEEKIINKRSKDLKVNCSCSEKFLLIFYLFFLCILSREHLLYRQHHCPQHDVLLKQKPS
jgi:hypothetical protein